MSLEVAEPQAEASLSLLQGYPRLGHPSLPLALPNLQEEVRAERAQSLTSCLQIM